MLRDGKTVVADRELSASEVFARSAASGCRWTTSTDGESVRVGPAAGRNTCCFTTGGRRKCCRMPSDPFDALDFAVRAVTACVDFARLPAEARALDLGCAVGRSSFELARGCREVLGIDFSSGSSGRRHLGAGGRLPYERTTRGADYPLAKRRSRWTSIGSGWVSRWATRVSLRTDLGRFRRRAPRQFGGPPARPAALPGTPARSSEAWRPTRHRLAVHVAGRLHADEPTGWAAMRMPGAGGQRPRTLRGMSRADFEFQRASRPAVPDPRARAQVPVERESGRHVAAAVS